MNKEELIQAAMQARKNSYSPYSGYKVGAAVLASSGKIYQGANIENASYPAGICAERSAIFCAASAGERKLLAIAITGGKEDICDDFAYPCGVCRQVMREFTDPSEFIIIVAKSAKKYEEYRLEELLPKSFGPDKLL